LAMHATPTGPIENVPQKIPILHPHQIINRPKKSALAPLFIARVDPEKLHVIRSTERIAVPERGVDIGNFDAATINENETWITTACTVKTGPAYLARIRWSTPNRLVVGGR